MNLQITLAVLAVLTGIFWFAKQKVAAIVVGCMFLAVAISLGAGMRLTGTSESGNEPPSPNDQTTTT